MLVGSTVRRVAIVGGSRIPFARAHGAFARVGNQDMLTASLRGLVEKYSLAGQRLGEVAAGAVIKHSKDYNLTRESLLSSGLSPETAGRRPRARVRNQPRGGHSRRQQDRARADRRRHRRGRRQHQRSAGRLSARVSRPAAAELSRPHAARTREAVARHCDRLCCGRSCPASSNHAPDFRWARAPSRWRRPGASRARRRTSSRTRAITRPRHRGLRASTTTWSCRSKG